MVASGTTPRGSHPPDRAGSAKRNGRSGPPSNGTAAVTPPADRGVRSGEPVSLQPYDFENSVGYWLILAARAYQKAFDVELAPSRLTYRQAQVLGWLVIDGELSQVELADRMMIEPATLVGVLDRMERDRLIQRTTVAGDRRKKVIQTSVAAAEVWDDVVECAKRIRATATQGLSDRQLAVFFKTLRTILRNLEPSQPPVDRK